MYDIKCVGHWNLVSEVGLPKPDRDVIFTYTNGVDNYRMVDIGAYYPEPIDETFECSDAGFVNGQLSNPESNYKVWFMYVCSPKNVIAWCYLKPYTGER